MVSSAEAAAYIRWAASGDPLLRRCISRRAFLLAQAIRFCSPRWFARISHERLALAHALDRELSLLKPANVIELGAGFSLRGLQWVDRHPGRYIEMDFPAVQRKKSAIFPRSEHHILLVGDAVTDIGKAKGCLRKGRTGIIIEGVLTYLQPEKVAALLSALRASFPKGTVLLTHAAKKAPFLRRLLWGTPADIDVQKMLGEAGWRVRESSGVLIAS